MTRIDHRFARICVDLRHRTASTNSRVKSLSEWGVFSSRLDKAIFVSPSISSEDLIA